VSNSSKRVAPVILLLYVAVPASKGASGDKNTTAAKV